MIDRFATFERPTITDPPQHLPGEGYKYDSYQILSFLTPAPAHWYALPYDTLRMASMWVGLFHPSGFSCLTPDPYQQIRGKV